MQKMKIFGRADRRDVYKRIRLFRLRWRSLAEAAQLETNKNTNQVKSSMYEGCDGHGIKISTEIFTLGLTGPQPASIRQSFIFTG